MELENKIFEIIKSNVKYNEEITLQTELDEDLNIGSFDRLMIINALEDEFKVQVEDSELSEIKTVNDIVEIIKKLIKT